MRLPSLIVAGLLVFASPSGAAPTRPDSQPAAPDAFAGELDRQLAGYGEWLVRLQEVQQPLQQMLVQFGPRWQAALQQGGAAASAAALRPFISEAVAVADATDAALARLTTPEFPALQLDDTLRPAKLVDEMRRYTGQVRTVVGSFTPLLEAIGRGDPRAAERALDQLMANVRLLLQSQILMARASLASVPQEEASHSIVEVQLLYFQAAERIISSWPGLEGRRDASLRGDLLRLADRLERTVATGLTRVDEETAQLRSALAAAEEEGDENFASLSRRTLAALDADRDVFPVGRELAAILRSHAPRFAGGTIPVTALSALFREIQPLRLRFDAIMAQEAAALAGR